MRNNPFIHTFETSTGFYIYDVNTDKILKVPEESYNTLKVIDKVEDGFTDPYILNLNRAGYLKSNRVEESEHPQTEVVKFILNTKLDTILLQVTQACNLKCEYCVYSGNYKNRSHSNRRMDIDTAKKAIDFLISHSKDSGVLRIGFYGGEPLLEIDLIEECIKYALITGEGREIYFNLTTNGTLLTNNVVSILSKYNVSVLVSMDGPEDIHDKGRKFANTGKGSHKIVIDNLVRVREEFPEYFKDKFAFNTVIDTENNFKCVDNYLSCEEIFGDSSFIYSLINDSYTNKQQQILEEFILDKDYELFKLFLSKLGWLDTKYVSKVLKMEKEMFGEYRNGKHVGGRMELPKKWHHGGPCIPGGFHTFITVDGNIYPCEKVSETSEVAKIGDIKNGFDFDKVEKILNIERVTEEECRNCWAYENCSVCIAKCDALNDVSKDLVLKHCSSIRRVVEDTFKDYCVLKELGYDFETADLYNF